jgi:hypothetical protein
VRPILSGKSSGWGQQLWVEPCTPQSNNGWTIHPVGESLSVTACSSSDQSDKPGWRGASGDRWVGSCTPQSMNGWAIHPWGESSPVTSIKVLILESGELSLVGKI